MTITELSEHCITTFHEHVVYKENGCIEWVKAHDTQGRGVVRTSSHKLMRAYRVAWILKYGSLDEGQVIRHAVCDNPKCVNPEHLQPGTQEDNHMDRVSHKRAPRDSAGRFVKL